eukprot:TRINITY_DN19921_c0_g1::TRINITY_DN19921_c0_g1_i1::g.28965::m.28965 TRINITY_DN19921_c0_g1::TRINITY_DN19921_c0_g1_i1::g.28965  ORF type:complete len:103 (-),score=-9.24,ABC_membrane/PF00664.18/91,ABC_membrane/PF00664.18/0.0075 TRINITY_DN19921_c0_g1_i1:24-332(-)
MILQEALEDKLAFGRTTFFSICWWSFCWISVWMTAHLGHASLFALSGTVMSKVAGSSSEKATRPMPPPIRGRETISNMRTIAAFAAEQKMRTRVSGPVLVWA